MDWHAFVLVQFVFFIIVMLAAAAAGQSAWHALLISILQTNLSTPPTAKPPATQCGVCNFTFSCLHSHPLCPELLDSNSKRGRGGTGTDGSKESHLLSENVH